jgi:membrane-bound lytic murein transglycosylase B
VKTALLVVLAALALAGCAPTMSPEAVATAQSEEKACDAGHTHVERARCRNAVYAKYGETGDLANVRQTERVALAEKVDAGTMTQAEAEAEFAKTVADTNSESRRRTAAAWDAMPKATTCNPNGVGGIICY